VGAGSQTARTPGPSPGLKPPRPRQGRAPPSPGLAHAAQLIAEEVFNLQQELDTLRQLVKEKEEALFLLRDEGRIFHMQKAVEVRNITAMKKGADIEGKRRDLEQVGRDHAAELIEMKVYEVIFKRALEERQVSATNKDKAMEEVRWREKEQSDMLTGQLQAIANKRLAWQQVTDQQNRLKARRKQTEKWLKPMRKKAEDQKKKLMAKQRETEQRLKDQEQRMKEQQLRIETSQKEQVIDTMLEAKTQNEEQDFSLFLQNVIDKFRTASPQMKKQYQQKVVAMLRTSAGPSQRTPRRASVIDVKNSLRLVEFGERMMETQEKTKALEISKQQEEARFASLQQQFAELSKQCSDAKKQGVYEGNDHTEADDIGRQVQDAEENILARKAYVERFTPLTQVAATGLKSLHRKVQAVTSMEVFLDDSEDIDITGSLDYIESRVQQLADILGPRLAPFSMSSLDDDAEELANLASRGEVVLPHLTMEDDEITAEEAAEAVVAGQGGSLEDYDFARAERGMVSSRAESYESCESDFNKRRPSSRSKAHIS